MICVRTVCVCSLFPYTAIFCHLLISSHVLILKWVGKEVGVVVN